MSERRVSLGAYSIYQSDKSKFWQLRATIRGEEIQRSTKETEPAKAKVRARVIYNDLVRSQPRGRSMSFHAVAQEFLKTRAARSPSTVRRIASAIKNLEKVFGFEISESTRVVPFYCSSSLAGFNELKYLKAIFKYAHSQGYIDRVPDIKMPRQISPGLVYTDDDIRDLLSASGDTLKLAVLMGFTMGLRIGEIVGIEISRIDLKNQTVTFNPKDTKTRTARTVTMSDAVFELIGTRVKKLKDASPWLFPLVLDPTRHLSTNGLDKLWQEAKRKAKVSGRFHDLRHTCATRLARAGVNSSLACTYLGMSLKVFDQVYSHLNVSDTAHVAKIVQLPAPSGQQEVNT